MVSTKTSENAVGMKKFNPPALRTTTHDDNDDVSLLISPVHRAVRGLYYRIWLSTSSMVTETELYSVAQVSEKITETS